jgi:hypothetical protein
MPPTTSTLLPPPPQAVPRLPDGVTRLHFGHRFSSVESLHLVAHFFRFRSEAHGVACPRGRRRPHAARPADSHPRNSHKAVSGMAARMAWKGIAWRALAIL